MPGSEYGAKPTPFNVIAKFEISCLFLKEDQRHLLQIFKGRPETPTVLAVNNVVWYKSLWYASWDNCKADFKVGMCDGECWT